MTMNNKNIEDLFGSFANKQPDALHERLVVLERKVVAQENKLVSHRKNFVKINDLLKEMVKRVESLEKEVATLKKRTHVDPVLWEQVVQRNIIFGSKETH